MKKLLLVIGLIALGVIAYTAFKKKNSGTEPSETPAVSSSATPTDSAPPLPGESPSGSTSDAGGAPKTPAEVSTAPSLSPSPSPSDSGAGSGGIGSTRKSAPVSSGQTPEEGKIRWIEGKIGLRGEHVQAANSFIEAIEEHNPSNLSRFFSSELKKRKSIAGHGNLNTFIRQNLMGEGFLGGLSDVETRKVRSLQEGAFVFSVKYEVSNPQNDLEDIPVTVKFQFEKIQGTYLITQIAETRG